VTDAAERPETVFRCAECGEVSMALRSDGAGVSVDCRAFTAWTGFVFVDRDIAERAITAADAATLYTLDRELVPYWCPECEAAYCKDHWQTWDLFDEEWTSWFDEQRGVCPRGHQRRIID
jgi:hypothetical protein